MKIKIKRAIIRINAIYMERGHPPRSIEDMNTMIKMAKKMEIPPDRFFEFVELLADGKTFEEARDALKETDDA